MLHPKGSNRKSKKEMEMAQAVDAVWLGEKLRAERENKGLTLKDVADETGVSVPTLSRIERGAAKGLSSDTYVVVSRWVGVDPTATPEGPSPVNRLPDVVELHLRADRNLDKKTADALATLFRTAYDTLAAKGKRGE